MHTVAAFTEGKNVPSSRYRVEQYVRLLNSYGIDLINIPSRFGKYPPKQKSLRPMWLLAESFSRLISVLKGNYSYDLVFLQRELISKFSYLEKLIQKPIIFDFDDSIFLGGNEKNISSIISRSNQVICGNSYLADWASKYSKDIHIVPTGIDSNIVFNPSLYKDEIFKDDQIIIGWIGTSSNHNNLLLIEGELEFLLNKYSNLKIAIMSDLRPKFDQIKKNKVIFKRWSPDVEASFCNSIDIGIMPLHDNPWNKGKCSFKAIQYMSMQKPVVISDVGMNKELVSNNFNGLLAKKSDDWIDSLNYLINSNSERMRLGNAARETICRYYDVRVLAKKIAEIIKNV